MFIKSFVAALSALALVVVPFGLLVLPAAHAQQPNPQILDIQAGCFLRIGRANNVLVKVGPLTTAYHFIFINTATQQPGLDQILGLVNPGEVVPFQLPAAGTYHLTVKYGASIANQTAVTSPVNIVVKQVTEVVLNGQKTCREKMSVSPDQQQKR
jgi:hypothetical protein